MGFIEIMKNVSALIHTKIELEEVTTPIEMMEWLMSQGEFRISKYEGYRNERIYAVLELKNGSMELRLESDTLQYEEGALEIVVTQLYERAKRAQAIYSV